MNNSLNTLASPRTTRLKRLEEQRCQLEVNDVFSVANNKLLRQIGRSIDRVLEKH